MGCAAVVVFVSGGLARWDALLWMGCAAVVVFVSGGLARWDALLWVGCAAVVVFVSVSLARRRCYDVVHAFQSNALTQRTVER